jgi:hypothetical protein
LQKQSSKRSISIVIIIAGMAAGLSMISYQYSTLAAEQILDVAAQDARSNAEI